MDLGALAGAALTAAALHQVIEESSAAGNHGGDDNHRNRAVRLFAAHYIPESAGRTLLTVGDALRAGAVRLEVEHAASFDIGTGEAAGPLQTGRATEVDINRQTAAMRADRRYVSVHTHRTSAAFSDLDVDVLLRNDPIKTEEARLAQRAKMAVTTPSTRKRPAGAEQPTSATPVEEALTTPAAFDLPAEEILQSVTDPEGIRIGNEAATEIRRRIEIEFGEPHKEA